MVTLTLPASLAALLPDAAGPGGRTVALDADDWPQVLAEIRRRYPRLAERVLSETGEVRTGFLVAVNDVVNAPDERPVVRGGDEVFLFAQIAGGGVHV